MARDVRGYPERIDLTTRRRRAVAWMLLRGLHAYEWAASRVFVEETPPVDDPFYRAPEGQEAHRPGEVLDTRAVEIRVVRHRIDVDAWNLRFRSTDTRDGAVPGVATVMVPRRPFHGPARPLLSYQPAIDSLGPSADPSYTLRRGNQIELAWMLRALRRGWAVVATDYTGPKHAFGVGPLAARFVLDGIRAAVSFAPAGLNDTTPIGLWGYSGGAQATLCAAELQPTYAPELPIVAAAAGGITGDPSTSPEVYADGALLGGVWFGAMIGISRELDVDLLGCLTPRGRALVDSAAELSFEQLLARFAYLRLGDYLTVPSVFDIPGTDAAIEAMRFGRATPSAALHLYHSVHDQNLAIAHVEQLVESYRRGGADVSYRPYRFGEHLVVSLTGTRRSLRFLADHFDRAAAAAGSVEGDAMDAP